MRQGWKEEEEEVTFCRKEDRWLYIMKRERVNGRFQGNGGGLEGPEGLEEENEGTPQVQPIERIWKGNQLQHKHNQGEINRFAVVYKTVPSDKVNLDEALKEYSECQGGKVRVRAEVR